MIVKQNWLDNVDISKEPMKKFLAYLEIERCILFLKENGREKSLIQST